MSAKDVSQSLNEIGHIVRRGFGKTCFGGAIQKSLSLSPQRVLVPLFVHTHI